MSLQRFIEYVNQHHCTHYNGATSTVTELQELADYLAPLLRHSTVLASGLSGVNLLTHVSMVESAREDLEKLGIHVEV